MITYINKANADKYRVLFSDAVKALQTHDSNGNLVGEPGAGDPVISSQPIYQEVVLTVEDFAGGDYYIWDEGSSSWVITELDAVFDENARYAIKIEAEGAISTLEEYFSYIADLRAINKRYTILPLDEEILEIDANKRTITLPAAFKANGIAVQGDEVAEILYFKINRFFDMDDLSTKDIFVQWKAPKDSEGNQVEGVSVPWVIDTESAPGFIIFGWPLASELTKIPGNIEFSVRFYTYNEEERKIVYSLSTLVTSASIKPGFDYNIADMLLDGSGIHDSNDLIINRLINSDVNDPNMPDPLPPTVIDNVITAFAKDSQLDEEGKHTIYNIYLTNPATGEETNGSYLIQATSDDAGAITYTWIKKDVDGELALNSLTSGIEFIETDDTERNPNKIYYQKKDEGVYTPYTFSSDDETLSDVIDLLGIQLYERMSRAIINATGEDVLASYQCRITNRVGRKTERIYGDIALVQGPVKPEITKDIAIDNTGIFKEEDNTLDVKVEANTDPHSYVEYTLQRSNASDGDYEPVETKANTNSFTVAGADYGEADDGDGYYRIVIESKLNSAIENVTGEPLRVTHKASPVTITAAVADLPNGGYDINKPISVTATVNEYEKRTADDNITYQWYRYNGSNLNEDFNAASAGEYVVANDIILKGEIEESCQIVNTPANENGYYFCQVTNHYNGTTAVKCSSFFNVVDAFIG